MISSLSTIFNESTDALTLKNCCRCIAALAHGDHARSDDALLALKDIAVTLRTRLLELQTAKAKLTDASQADSEVEETAGDIDGSMSLCLHRLCVLSKRYSVTELLGEEEAADTDLDAIAEAVASYLKTELTARAACQKAADGTDLTQVPEIWSTQEDSIHATISDSVSYGMDLLLCLVSWRLGEEIQKIDDGKTDYDDEDISKHVVVRLRDRLLGLCGDCYNHFIDSNDADEFTAAHQSFSIAVQEHALRVSGDLRSLFPRKWSEAKSPFLVACAIADDSQLSGLSTRFVRSQSARVRGTMKTCSN